VNLDLGCKSGLARRTAEAEAWQAYKAQRQPNPGEDYQKDAVYFSMEAKKWQSKAERYEIEVMALRDALRGMVLIYDVLEEATEKHAFAWPVMVGDTVVDIMNEYREDAKKILSGGLKDEETSEE